MGNYQREINNLGKVIKIGSVNEYNLYKKEIKKGKIKVLLVASIHGSEPAGFYTIKYLLKKCPDAHLIIYPCLNPYGFENKKRKNVNELDLNREFNKKKPAEEIRILKKDLKKYKKFDIAIELHEDNPKDLPVSQKNEKSPKGFYMYENCKNKNKRIGKEIIKVLENKKIPICKKKKIYDDINNNGVISYPEGRKNKVYKKKQNFDDFITSKYCDHVFTFETSTRWNMGKRTKIHLDAIITAIKLKRKQ